MRPYLILFVLLGWCTASFCQTGRVTGSVTEGATRSPLELATVSIFGPDSSLLTYQLSDKNGKFTLEKLPLRKKLVVSVTYTGYTAYRRPILLEGGRTDTLAVVLSLNQKDTQAVVVAATIPVRMNGDTLEINPAAFKMKENAVVEELLNQVPGMTIWSDGSITVNGNKVQSLLVDGKPFMGSTDSRVATQNLPKAAIEKIQLYQEYDRSTISQQSGPQDSLLTMNIKLKEASKKGYFGKAGAGYGTTGRMESDLSFQVYNQKSSGGIGGGFNNINKNIGNLQELFQNNTYRNYNPNLYSVGRFGTNGINKNHSIGGVFTHNFIETANSRQNNRVALNYNKSGTDAYITDLGLQNRTTPSNPQFVRDEGIQNNRQSRHELGIHYVRSNSYSDNLSVNGSVNTSDEAGTSSRFSEVSDTAGRILSTNTMTAQHSRRSDNGSLNGSFARSDYEDPLKGFNLQFFARRGHAQSEREVGSIFQSFTDGSKNTATRRHYAARNQSLHLGGTLDYTGFKRLLLGRYNLFGLALNFTQSVNYSRSTDQNTVGDYDSTTKGYTANSYLTNHNTRDLFEYTPSLAVAKSYHKRTDIYSRYINVQVKLSNELKADQNESSFAKRNLERSFRLPRYEGNINYQRQKREKHQYNLSLYYTQNQEYPSVDQLYTIVDDINVYDTRIGNPQLRNRTNHSVSLNGNFNTQNNKSVYAVNSNLGGNIRRTLNPVTDSIINDFSGKRIHYYTNAGRSDNLSLNYSVNISRKLKKNSLQLMYRGQFSTGKMPNYIDGISNSSETGNLSNQFTLQYTLGSLLVVNIGQTLQQYQTRQTAPGLRSFKNNSNTTKLGMVLNYPAHFTFSSTADHVANTNLDQPTILWNAFATYRFMKEQGELKFSAMDLLKQYQNIFNSANAYGTTTRFTNGLQQYFLLTFSYFPRKFGKTELKRG